MVRNKSQKKDVAIVTDPFGAYTGRPAEPGEQPVQDADDL